jgi:peptidoglycan hydrolase CwlO-like protein
VAPPVPPGPLVSEEPKKRAATILRGNAPKGYYIGKHESDINHINSHLTLLHTEVSGIKSQIIQIDVKIDKIHAGTNNRIDKLTIEIDNLRNQLNTKIDNKFDGLCKDMEKDKGWFKTIVFTIISLVVAAIISIWIAILQK